MIGEMDNLFFTIPEAIQEAVEKNGGWYMEDAKKPAFQRFDELMQAAYTMKYNVKPDEVMPMSALRYSEYKEPNCNFHNFIFADSDQKRQEQNLSGYLCNLDASIMPPYFFSENDLGSQEESCYTAEVTFEVVGPDNESQGQIAYTIKLPTPKEEITKGKLQ